MKEPNNLAVSFIVVFGGFLLLVFLLGFFSSESNEEPVRYSDDPTDVFFDGADCRTTSLTRWQLQEIADMGGIDMEITQEFTDRFNSLPMCP